MDSVSKNICDKYDLEYKSIGLGFSKKEQKWYGWSHRACAHFGIGDMLFEADLIGTSRYKGLPVQRIGHKTIETLDEAKEAAQNFAHYAD